jgi:hypothetical protein
MGNKVKILGDGELTKRCGVYDSASRLTENRDCGGTTR